MQTLEIPAVTQVRASCDYHPGNTDGCKAPYCQYNVGTSSLLAYATGLAPSKDNWWTSEHQPGGAFIFKMGVFHRMQGARRIGSVLCYRRDSSLAHVQANLVTQRNHMGSWVE
jgi:hypothetical protein